MIKFGRNELVVVVAVGVPEQESYTLTGNRHAKILTVCINNVIIKGLPLWQKYNKLRHEPTIDCSSFVANNGCVLLLLLLLLLHLFIYLKSLHLSNIRLILQSFQTLDRKTI